MLNGDLSLYGALSLGNWEWENDVVASVVSDYDRSGETYDIAIYAGGLKVGDAPQRQLSLGSKYKTPFGLVINPVFRLNDLHYADYDPADLDDESIKGSDDYQFQIDPYSVIDLHVSYNTGDLLPVPVNLGFHILNLTDTEYFADYIQGDGGFYGAGTTFNLSLGVSF
jgi:hypothetical protein